MTYHHFYYSYSILLILLLTSIDPIIPTSYDQRPFECPKYGTPCFDDAGINKCLQLTEKGCHLIGTTRTCPAKFFCFDPEPFTCPTPDNKTIIDENYAECQKVIKQQNCQVLSISSYYARYYTCYKYINDPNLPVLQPTSSGPIKFKCWPDDVSYHQCQSLVDAGCKVIDSTYDYLNRFVCYDSKDKFVCPPKYSPCVSSENTKQCKELVNSGCGRILITETPNISSVLDACSIQYECGDYKPRCGIVNPFQCPIATGDCITQDAVDTCQQLVEDGCRLVVTPNTCPVQFYCADDLVPTSEPSSTPTTTPMLSPSDKPSTKPSLLQSDIPSSIPTIMPSNEPISQAVFVTDTPVYQADQDEVKSPVVVPSSPSEVKESTPTIQPTPISTNAYDDLVFKQSDSPTASDAHSLNAYAVLYVYNNTNCTGTPKEQGFLSFSKPNNECFSDPIGNRGYSSSNNRYCGVSTGFWHETVYKGSNKCGTELNFVSKFCQQPGGAILLPKLCQKVIGISKIYTTDSCVDGIQLKSCTFVSLKNATFYNDNKKN